MEKYFDLLSANPLFQGIDREDLGLLLGCLQARVAQVSKGAPVFLEGDPAGFMGIVLYGSIQIVQDDYYGKRSVLGQREAGQIFAETYACSRTEQMPVSGYALKDSAVMLFSCRKMMTVCVNACRFHNMLVQNLLQVVAQESLQLGQKIRFMSCKTTREKLMAYLLEEAKKAGSSQFTIPFDRQALADYLGVERSAMSVELSKLRDDGVLTTRGSYFCLL